MAACETAPHCGNASYGFESVQSGRVRSDPTSATTFADLNSPALARKVCSPLRVPKANIGSEEDLYRWAARPGTMTFYGGSVMANGRFRDGGTGLFLERCGSYLHRFIDYDSYDDVAANAHMVLWQSRDDQLSGLWLPSLRRFVIPLTAARPVGADHRQQPVYDLPQLADAVRRQREWAALDGENPFALSPTIARLVGARQRSPASLSDSL